MVAHTPGPWKLQDEQIIAGDGTAAVALVYGADDFLCLDDDEGIQQAAAECKANGNLIAGAPDLLTACKAVLEAHDTNGWSEPGISDAFYGAIEQLRAAIARATGGQP